MKHILISYLPTIESKIMNEKECNRRQNRRVKYVEKFDYL